MRKARILNGVLVAAPLILALLLMGCSGAENQVRRVPQDGYDQTHNYQFQARVHTDESGACQQRVVRVKPLNKLYTRMEPPPRLQLFDDDCESPLGFERARYVSNDTGENVSLSGAEVAQFWSEHTRLKNELVGWLWRSDVI